jgi:hypothetical protein
MTAVCITAEAEPKAMDTRRTKENKTAGENVTKVESCRRKFNIAIDKIELTALPVMPT